jgi:hypothetical protein
MGISALADEIAELLLLIKESGALGGSQRG